MAPSLRLRADPDTCRSLAVAPRRALSTAATHCTGQLTLIAEASGCQRRTRSSGSQLPDVGMTRVDSQACPRPGGRRRVVAGARAVRTTGLRTWDRARS
jgi:hypothetical protein